MPSRKELANAIRALSMDAVQQANSGHPGAPMGLADVAEVLWNDFLKHNPANPLWPDRDRFVLSNGHASMLLYSLLHLSGYAVGIDEIRNFRQLHSKTPGHPEHGVTPGVETTTGPLGQGIANAVGMALAERMLGEQFNREGLPIVDHRTYVILGDGCMMEGVSHEACCLAGTLGLGKLIALYDDNGISIDGNVRGWFAEDTPARFEAYGWHVVRDVDGHDAGAVQAALEQARSVTDRPSLVCCRTVIGFGAPNVAGSEKTHGAPLGEKEIAAARQELHWAHPPFVVPEDVRAAWDARGRGAQAEAAWRELFARYRAAHPDLAAEFERRMAGDLPADFEAKARAIVEEAAKAGKAVASRKASQEALEAFGPLLPELAGGSADLTGSNLTKWSGSKPVTPLSFGGNYLFYGVREFGMSAIMNGMALHGGFIPYGGTFLVFSDYSRNAIRLAALSRLRVVHVLTHDSIGLGEDGPTHQPVEQTASLQLIPGLSVWRPCDAMETMAAWKAALERRDGPTALILSRQTLRNEPRSPEALEGMARGGYVLRDCAAQPEVVLLSTGSEVGLVMDAAEMLTNKGRRVRVVSLPSLDVFEAQDAAYRESVLPSAVKARVAVEAGVTALWYKHVGPCGRVIGLDRFGVSAPAEVLFPYFGFTAENVVRAAEEAMACAAGA